LSDVERAKIFKNGQSQAVRLPKQLRFKGREVYAKKLGNAVVLLPVDDAWQPLRESLARFSDDFLRERPAQPRQARESLDD
jgi:antitoxin VapB